MVFFFCMLAYLRHTQIISGIKLLTIEKDLCKNHMTRWIITIVINCVYFCIPFCSFKPDIMYTFQWKTIEINEIGIKSKSRTCDLQTLFPVHYASP